MEHDEQIRRLFDKCLESGEFSLSSIQKDLFVYYFKELSEWNKKLSLTALKDPVDIIANLFIDSLAGRVVIAHEPTTSVADVGSGAGFPGIPLSIILPHCRFTLVEPSLKKTTFLHHIIGTLRLDNVYVISKTIQDIAKHESGKFPYDYIFAKAIKPESIFPSVLSLLHSQSVVGLYRSRPLGKKKSYYGMNLVREIDYDLPFGYGSRTLSLLQQ